eukprot:COSAG01_NODE_1372_length_10545_cov_12.262876_1_plen_91_part_00
MLPFKPHWSRCTAPPPVFGQKCRRNKSSRVVPRPCTNYFCENREKHIEAALCRPRHELLRKLALLLQPPGSLLQGRGQGGATTCALRLAL